MPLDKMLRMKAQCLENMNRNAEALAFMNRAYAVLDSVKQSDIEKSMSEFTVKYKTRNGDGSLNPNARLPRKPIRCCGLWWR